MLSSILILSRDDREHRSARVPRGRDLREDQQARFGLRLERSDLGGVLEHQRYHSRCVDVAGPQVYHLRGRPEQDAHSSEVVILRQNRESAFTRCRPDFGVETASEAEGFDVGATWIAD